MYFLETQMHLYRLLINRQMKILKIIMEVNIRGDWNALKILKLLTDILWIVRMTVTMKRKLINILAYVAKILVPI